MNDSRCIDHAGVKERIVLWVLITVGIEAVLYFADWWLEPAHRRNISFFIFLTFAIFQGLYRSLANWFCFLFIKGTPHKAPLQGIAVDVFTTAMPGEPYSMFEKTLAAIVAIRYPHTSYLLDGGNDPGLSVLCKRLGIHHLDCREIKGTKAEKVNNALGRSHGEIVLVIDPDHIPEPVFLDNVLGHFQDPVVGFVQVVQGYYNQAESMVARAGAEQTYSFYGPTMMGMNGLGTTVAIGANCTFRRKALESIGGHAVDLAEDLVTSIRLHAQGWKSVYVPKRLSFGLNPADLHSYFKQQLKWSTGMFNAFFGEYFKAFRRFKYTQKLHYFFAGTYYFDGVAAAITSILPILFLFFGLWAVEMELNDFLIHIMPYGAMTFFIGWYVQRWYRHGTEKGILWRGMFLKKGTWPIYLLGLTYSLTRTKVPYLPTPKIAEKGIFTNLVIPHLAVLGLSAAAIVYALLTYDRFVAGTQLMMFFAACNILLLLPTVIIAHAAWFKPERGGRS
jgi:cellulose synthase (UDP-forming)